MNSKGPPTLRVPQEIASIIRRGEFSNDSGNPLVVFEFVNGQKSLFDTRKGLFLSRPEGIALPERETLKAFGRLVQSFRRQSRSKSPIRLDGLEEVDRFAVCS